MGMEKKKNLGISGFPFVAFGPNSMQPWLQTCWLLVGAGLLPSRSVYTFQIPQLLPSPCAPKHLKSFRQDHDQPLAQSSKSLKICLSFCSESSLVSFLVSAGFLLLMRQSPLKPVYSPCTLNLVSFHCFYVKRLQVSVNTAILQLLLFGKCVGRRKRFILGDNQTLIPRYCIPYWKNCMNKFFARGRIHFKYTNIIY
jgi:hypothetical protein